MIHGHGSDLYKYKTQIIADFSSNVWYKGLPTGLLEHLKNNLHKIFHYPEPDASELASNIALIHHVKTENVLITNGATEAFYLIAQLFQKSKSLISIPSFAEYEDACNTYSHNITFIENNHLETTITIGNNTLLWLGNPNNPDGKVFSKIEIQELSTRNKNSFIIVDEAYGDLCYNFESSLELLNQCKNLIIIRSLTKAFAIPGIRLGYILASTEIIDKIKNIKMPWSVNTLAIEAGLFITKNYQELLPNKNVLEEECIAFYNLLKSLKQVNIHPSKCNYFLLELEKGNASELKAFLIENYGLLIRDASNFKGLMVKHFRVALQSPENNKKLIKGIKNYIEKFEL